MEVAEVPTKILVRNSLTYLSVMMFIFLISLLGSLLLLLPFRILSMFIGHGEILFVILLMLTVNSVGTAIELWTNSVKSGEVVEMNLEEMFNVFRSRIAIIFYGCIAIFVLVAVTFAVSYLTTETYGLLAGALIAIVILLLDDLISRKVKYSISSSVFILLIRSRRIRFVNPFQQLASILLGIDGSAT